MSNSEVEHKYHLVNPSPWPVCGAFAAMIMLAGAVLWMHQHNYGIGIFSLGAVALIFTAVSWWSDVIKEGTIDQAHSSIVRKGLSIGMLLFITSEIMFFGAFFGSFLYSSIDPLAVLPDGEVWSQGRGVWPAANIKTIDPWNIPFLNTLLLLLSGTTVTWAHYAIDKNNSGDAIKALTITVLLGITFTALQAFEYVHAEFQWKEGIYPSNFYLATGFHGLHVIIGTIFLTICLIRVRKGQFAQGKGHLGFIFAAWYWHFVDAVWLYLFAVIYIWGS